MNSSLKYLTNIKKIAPHSFWAEDLLTYGKSFDKTSPCPKEFRGPLGQCYTNSGQVALNNSRYIYCEGYACTKSFDFPFMHAWLYDTETQQFTDPTWADGQSYLGIPIKTSTLRNYVLDTRTHGELLYSRFWFDLKNKQKHIYHEKEMEAAG